MKINLKSLLSFKKLSVDGLKGDEEIEYDKAVDFYYTNLINSLILFSLTEVELEKLASPVFDPIFELESEIDYAFLPVCFETVFRMKAIDLSLKTDLLDFKQEVDNIPQQIWDWRHIDTHHTWIRIRQQANTLLNKLGITSRIYNDTYVTIYDNKGNVLNKGKSPQV